MEHVHRYCSAQLSMFNVEKRYRNKIIIIIILTLWIKPICGWVVRHGPGEGKMWGYVLTFCWTWATETPCNVVNQTVSLSVTSISVWWHIQLSKQTHVWDTLGVLLGLLLLLPRSIWWLRWLDSFSRECRISRCQEQILCRPPELGFEGHTSGSYLLPCLLMEWAGL